MNSGNSMGEKNGLPKIQKENDVDFFGLAQKIIDDLPKRSREIIRKRYGLEGESVQTLDKIGRDYGITRERVRQIIADALRIVGTKIDEKLFLEGEARLIFTIEKNNGIISEEEIVSKLGFSDRDIASAIKFLAQCSNKIKRIHEKNLIEKAWAVSEDILLEVRKVEAEAEKILKAKKETIEEGEFVQELSNRTGGISKDKIRSFLKVFSKIKKNPFGKWGLSDWKEIMPKGTREKIYLILKETKKPLHFSQIAKLIDQYQLGKRRAHPQTVHNELIKDDRFVLIGRGIYAMAEWGYSEGTIQDVLHQILKESRKPLQREEILKRVLKVRKVKKATVMINLNNSKIFSRQDNLYTVRKR